jgi:hypothetical protein
MGSGNIETDYDSGKTVSLDFVSIKCVTPISVGNARWQISMLVSYSGDRPFSILRVYVNDDQVDEYGLIHGDSLEDGSQIGTSVPSDGMSIESGNVENIYVWVGNELFSSGSQIVIRFNDPHSVTMMKAITLS